MQLHHPFTETKIVNMAHGLQLMVYGRQTIKIYLPPKLKNYPGFSGAFQVEHMSLGLLYLTDIQSRNLRTLLLTVPMMW